MTSVMNSAREDQGDAFSHSLDPKESVASLGSGHFHSGERTLRGKRLPKAPIVAA